MPNQEINVDIKINSDALNQLPKYKAGFDSLRDAVFNLNREIVSSTEKLSKLNTENKETVTWGSKIKGTVKELYETYKTFREVVVTVAKELRIATTMAGGWASILAGAFTLITTYGPQVLEYLDHIFDSEKARNAAQSLKDYNDVMTSYIDIVAGGLSEAGMLVNIASNTDQKHAVRVEALKKLISLSPQHLQNLTLENIKTKEGTALVNEYTKSLKSKALIESTKGKRTDYIKQRETLKKDLEIAKQNWQDYKTGKKESSTNYNDDGSTWTDEEDAKQKYLITKNESVQKDLAILKQIKALDNQLNKSLIPTAADYKIKQIHNKAFWEADLAHQEELLSKIDNTSKESVKKAKIIKLNRDKAKKMLAFYEDIPKQKIAVKINNNSLKKSKPAGPDPEEERLASIARMAKLNLEGYAKEIADADDHFREMKGKFHEFLDDYSKMSKEDKDKNAGRFKATNKALEQFEVEHQTTLNSITKKFQEEDFKKLDDYYQELNKIGKDARKQAFDQLQIDYMQKQADVDKILENNKKVERDLQNQIFDLAGQDPNKLSQAQLAANQQKIEELEKLRANAESAVARAKTVSDQLRANNIKDTGKLLKGFANEDKKAGLEDSIAQDEKTGNWQKEFTDKQHLLDLEYQQAIEAEGLIGSEKLKIQRKYKDDTAQLNKAKQDAEVANQKKYLQSLTSVASAVTGIFGKNTIAARLAFKAQQAAAAAQVIIETKKSIMNIWSANSGIPFVGVPKAIAETALVAAVGASNLAAIIKQKPGFARGGQYTSDGRGALLPGYSRTDNTNAYLRSGEAVVVSEAMRNPWARNLVSAINVAHGGRDFSVPNAGRGYAIGGIFTDGGNANRYYSQPVNDQKDLANTLAYQMINNFPPIYVDVKDVNNQQNILAQTVDRVNL
jgi:hypothetical protein